MYFFALYVYSNACTVSLKVYTGMIQIIDKGKIDELALRIQIKY